MIRGESLRWSESEIAAMSVTGESDIVRARQWWRRYAPTRYRELLSDTEWDAASQEFILKKPVDGEQIKTLILLILLLVERDIVERSRQMFEGSLSLESWQQQFADDIKFIHLNAWAAGVGGYGQLDSTDFGLISANLRYQYDRLEKFARQAEGGFQQADSQGDVVGRSKLYVRAGNPSYEEAKGWSHEGEGFLYERNILGNAEHCAGCVTETDRGWVPIGTLVPVGGRICLVNCKCAIIYERTKPN